MQRSDRRFMATVRKGMAGQPVYRTRRERRLLEKRQQEQTRRAEDAAAVARFVRTDDASRRRAVRIASGSAYGAQHRRIAFMKD